MESMVFPWGDHDSHEEDVVDTHEEDVIDPHEP
jgi:hypothetical protein